MTTDAAIAVKRLLAAAPDTTDAKAIAAHATSICQTFAQHVSLLVGELGMLTLFVRSLALASSVFPCVAKARATGTETPYESLRRCLEQEAPDAAMECAIHVFQTFIQLLERFIGTALVTSLLHEVWPTFFSPTVPKEPK
jgi:hypothetical protein